MQLSRIDQKAFRKIWLEEKAPSFLTAPTSGMRSSEAAEGDQDSTGVARRPQHKRKDYEMLNFRRRVGASERNTGMESSNELV